MTIGAHVYRLRLKPENNKGVGDPMHKLIEKTQVDVMNTDRYNSEDTEGCYEHRQLRQ